MTHTPLATLSLIAHSPIHSNTPQHKLNPYVWILAFCGSITHLYPSYPSGYHPCHVQSPVLHFDHDSTQTRARLLQ